MTTKYILLLALVGVGVYLWKRQSPAASYSGGLGAAINNLFGNNGLPAATEIPTNGTLAGTTAWDGSTNTSTTTYGPSFADAFDSVDA